MKQQTFHVRISDGRRIVLPPEACKTLKVDVGGTLIVDVSDGGVELHTVDSTVEHFRKLLASKVPPNVSIVDDLLAERRAEAERE
jgi:bifunctional DNA-binding transcriptional regulator/antitoxin component of YhaV-PrlF toxin-antitoxin module